MLQRLCSVVIAGILSGFTFLLLTGRYINDGPVLVTVVGAHGLHAGDLFVIAGWAVGMAALAMLTWPPRRHRPQWSAIRRPRPSAAEQEQTGGEQRQ